MTEILALILAAVLAAPSRVVIPFLASAARPDDLAFEGAECTVAASGTEMRCEFHQVFLTTSDLVRDTCLVTTNQYEKAFTREADGTWRSTAGPDGACGLVETTTLTDAGEVRWTMEIRKRVTGGNADSSCSAGEGVEILSWQNLRRPLPCRFIQPGGLSR